MGLCGPREHYLPVLLDQAVGQRPPLRAAPGPATTQVAGPARAARARAAAALRLAQRLIERIGDGAPCPGQMTQQRIGVGQAKDPGHLVLFLQHQPVAGPAGHLVQGVPCVQDGLLRGPGPRPWPGSYPGRGHGVDGLRVAQAAPGLLEVGFEQERQVAAARGPLLMQHLQLRQPGAGARTPVRQDTGAQVAGQPPIPGDVPGVQQAEGHPHVLAGHLARLGRAAYGMVKPGARVPDGIPDPVGQRGDARPPGVEQQHVEVAARQQLAPAVAADRD